MDQQNWTQQQIQYYYWYLQQVQYQQQLQMQQAQMYYQQQSTTAINLGIPLQTKTKQKKLSQHQKNKLKYEQNKKELERERKEIGNWVNLESKKLIQQIQKYQQSEKKRIEKKKLKLSHLIQIQKQVYKLRKKMGLLKADTTRKKIMNALQPEHNRHKKKPSRLKQLNKLYHEKYLKPIIKMRIIKQAGKTVTNNENSEYQQQQIEKMIKKQQKFEIKQITQKTATIIQYPLCGKLTGQKWNNIEMRQWVDHMPSNKLQQSLLILINKLSFQQAIKKIKQPLKAKKRIVAGFHEVSRTLNSIIEQKKCKCLIIALNITRNPFKQGSDDNVINLIQNAKRLGIPIMHCSTRAKLGRSFTGKFGPRISVISIINYQGCEELVNQILEQWNILKKQYLNN